MRYLARSAARPSKGCATQHGLRYLARGRRVEAPFPWKPARAPGQAKSRSAAAATSARDGVENVALLELPAPAAGRGEGGPLRAGVGPRSGATYSFFPSGATSHSLIVLS